MLAQACLVTLFQATADADTRLWLCRLVVNLKQAYPQGPFVPDLDQLCQQRIAPEQLERIKQFTLQLHRQG